MSDPLLDVRNLHVQFDTYEGRAEVIDGIDFTIDRSETAALVGETGCGKSVTVKTIIGLLPEAIIPEGEIYFDGTDLLQLSDAERRAFRSERMGFIMQDPMTALNPVFTVGEQMMDSLRWKPNERVSITNYVRKKFADESAMRQRCIDMLGEVQISAPERVFESYPSELSGGMAQRILIAMALLKEPEFLIADEPGTALDVTTENVILKLLNKLVDENDTSVLYITHDLGVARKVSQRVNVMYAGELVEKASTREIFDNPQHPYTRGLLESIPTLSGGMGAGIEGNLPDYVDPPTGCRFKDRCAYAKPECGEVFPYPRETTDGHSVACHLWQGPNTLRRHDEQSMTTVDIGAAPWLTEDGGSAGQQAAAAANEDDRKQ